MLLFGAIPLKCQYIPDVSRENIIVEKVREL